MSIDVNEQLFLFSKSKDEDKRILNSGESASSAGGWLYGTPKNGGNDSKAKHLDIAERVSTVYPENSAKGSVKSNKGQSKHRIV